MLGPPMTALYKSEHPIGKGSRRVCPGADLSKEKVQQLKVTAMEKMMRKGMVKTRQPGDFNGRVLLQYLKK